MKITYLMITFGFILLGCGSNDNSKPEQDEKVEIDRALYLPKEDMVKNYDEYGFRYHGTSQEHITVSGNTIKIDYIQEGTYYNPEGNKYTTIKQYDDMNIIVYQEETNETQDRYVTDKEIINESNTKVTENYICQNTSEGCEDNEIIGNILEESYSMCLYEKINNAYEVEEDFLKRECKSRTYRTIKLNNKYKFNTLINWREGKSGQGHIYTVYYKKEFGFYGDSYSPFYISCEGNICEDIFGAPGGSGRRLLE